MTRRYNRNGTTHAIYESLSNQINDAVAWGKGQGRNEEASGYASGNQSSFVGRKMKGWDGVRKATQEPWEHGQDVLQRFVDRLMDLKIPMPKDRRRRTRFNEDDGDEIDLDRLRAGQPYWRKSERQETHGPQTMTIICDLGTSSFVNSDDILWRGAAAVAMAMRLESMGYRCEIWTTGGGPQIQHARNGNTGSQRVSCCVKRTSDPLDVATLINAVAGWYYRTIVFALKEYTAHEMGTKYQRSYGPPRIPTAKELDELTADEARVLVAGAFSFHDAASIVEGEIKRFAEMH